MPDDEEEDAKARAARAAARILGPSPAAGQLAAQAAQHEAQRLAQLAELKRLAAVADMLPRPAHVTAKRMDPEALLAAVAPASKVPGYWEALEENAATWAGEVSAQPFWKKLGEAVLSWEDIYRRRHGGGLFAEAKLDPFQGKEMPRLREKVLAQLAQGKVEDLFPDGESPVPCINDMVRTRIATKFLDGVGFLAERLAEHLHERSPRYAPQARATGYYANHLYFDLPVLFRFGGSERMVKVTCEVQIATELSTTVWDRAHGAYELARVSDGADNNWQWDPRHERFIAAQLAHMIHLADGLVVQLRDAVAARRKGPKE